MAKVAHCYADNTGGLHATPCDAAIADLTAILGRIGAESGLTTGLAKLLIDKRADIEQAYADFDHMRNFAEQQA